MSIAIGCSGASSFLVHSFQVFNVSILHCVCQWFDAWAGAKETNAERVCSFALDAKVWVLGLAIGFDHAIFFGVFRVIIIGLFT